MTCKYCNSSNTIVQAKEAKSPVMIGCILLCLGLGLMIFGIVGAMAGLIIGLIIGAILKAIFPKTYETVVVCQNCGKTYTVKTDGSGKP